MTTLAANAAVAPEVTRLRDENEVLTALLQMALAPGTLDEVLARSLDLLLGLPWLEIEARGAILLLDATSNTLVMRANRGLAPHQVTACASVRLGECLCGSVGHSGEPIYCAGVDERHSHRYPHMQPHGHVVLPIKVNHQTLGVINLYVPEGHETNATQRQFLENIANTLALVIQHHQASDALQESERHFRHLLQAAPDALVIAGAGGRIDFINHQAEQMLGYQSAELVGEPVETLLPESLRAAHVGLRDKFLAAPRTRSMGEGRELTVRRKDGSEFPAEISLSPMGDNGRTQVMTAIRDTTERRRRERDYKHVASFATYNPNPVIEVDTGGNVTYLNPAAKSAFPKLEAQGTTHPMLAGIEVVVDHLRRAGKDATLREVDFDDTIFEQKIVHIPDFGVTRVYAWDISSLRRLAHELKHQASHDALTGLINRSEFEFRLERALEGARDNDEHHILLYIDLDQFKIVNDTCGHIAGDELLRQITTVLKDRVRESDTLARLGGDEFGLLLLDCPLEKGHHIAENIRDAVAKYRFCWEQKTFDIGASIGLVGVTTESGELKDILSAADAACYVAKDHGRNR